jgi:hypothetical protein
MLRVEHIVKKIVALIFCMGLSTSGSAVVPVITPERILCDTDLLVEARVIGGKGAKCQLQLDVIPVCASYGRQKVLLKAIVTDSLEQPGADIGSRWRVRTDPVFRETFANSPDKFDPGSSYYIEKMGRLIFPHVGADITDQNVRDATEGKSFIFGFARDGRNLQPTGAIWPLTQKKWIEDTRKSACGRH